ncbi:MAG: PRC-barrel domain-containing protein [Phycisphaerae bacterium]
MLDKANSLTGYKLESLDGEIGKVRDFYFDDQHWAIRYLVADTGNWLTGRQVLISPYALAAVTKEARHIAVKLTRKQIEDSPSLDTNKPVSKQFEEAYYGYYAWPIYWGGPYIWGAYSYPGMLATPPGVTQVRAESREITQDKKTWDPHLRSTHDVRGHHIQATDGEIGHIEDFVIDDQTWAIRYLIIDTRNWWPGKKVLVSPQWIDHISWGESKLFVSLSRAAIKQAPEYTEESLLSREYEAGLHRHYSREGYWVNEPTATEHFL